MSPAFTSWQDFWSMGGYAFYVWLSIVSALLALFALVIHTRWQRHRLLTEIRRQQSRADYVRQHQHRELGYRSSAP